MLITCVKSYETTNTVEDLNGLNPGVDTRGVQPIYLRCNQGKIQWKYPRGGLRVGFWFAPCPVLTPLSVLNDACKQVNGWWVTWTQQSTPIQLLASGLENKMLTANIRPAVASDLSKPSKVQASISSLTKLAG
ncbi:hypothetical protein GQR58_022874 [Nymphon striatum]|nr:hypothetical protein GQR58_022874 [Nymphon striatum]